MNPRVVAVAPLQEHILLVQFSDGDQRQMNVAPYLAYPVFDRLRDPAFFALVRADHGTVCWPGGIDLDPDSVYLDSVALTSSEPA